MSDEFIQVATKEIHEELDEIKKIINICENDADVSKNCKDIEKHTHKIKGLAPMMEKSDVGTIALLNDKLLKHMIDGKSISGIYQIIFESNDIMKQDMQGSKINAELLIQKINDNYSEFLD
jgi:chemotaxis protein histidine kinase CheA